MQNNQNNKNTKNAKNKSNNYQKNAKKKQNNKRKKTFKYRHVKLNMKRPELTQGKYNPKKGKKKSPGKSSDIKIAGGVEFDSRATLRIIPIGGLDAIGKNMTALECGDDLVLDDAGLMFPDETHPGVDLILPDYTYILEKADKLRGIFITHGHEDHIGCLPYLIKDLACKVPIYGTKLTIGLIKAKFEEFNIRGIPFHEIKSEDTINIGKFKITFFSVNHSIPGAVGAFIQTPAGNLLHTGDFKLDQSPIDDVTMDFSLISKFSKVGVDVLLSDSTNATVNEFTPSESAVGPVLKGIIQRARGRVVIAAFASHIHRIQQVCDAAQECGRKVIVTGRSMVQNTEIARKLGYLNVSDENIVDAYYADNIPPEKSVILCTGSQGEPLSALSRIANDCHKRIHIDRGDTVIISATPVPGNEKAVAHVVNNLAKMGVNVYDKSRAPVHVSGHAAREELKIMIGMVNPRAFIPVHGEAIHLLSHSKLAKQAGVNPKNIFVCENGDVIELRNKKFYTKDPVQSGVIFVDGLSVGDTSEGVLLERGDLGNGGIAVISAAVDTNSNKIRGSLHVTLRGVTGGDEQFFHDDLRKCVYSALTKALKRNVPVSNLRKSAKDALLSLLWERTKQRPMVIVNIIEI